MEDGNQLISASTPGKIKKIPKSALTAANKDLDLGLASTQRWGH